MGLNVAMVTSWKVRCGISSYSANLADALAKLGVNIYIVRLPRFGFKNPELMQNIATSVPVDKIELIHVQHEYGLYQNLEAVFYLALKQLKKPIVTTMHSVGAWEIDKVIADFSDRIIVHNEFCAGRFDFPEKTGIIPHGTMLIETPAPPIDTCKKSLGIDPKIPLIGYVGFISTYKGLESLIEAMSKVPNAALLICGGWFVERETQYIVELKERTLRDLPGRCQWFGYVSDEDLSRVYGAMDVVCYPSRFSTESGALIMALSHGKALVASSIPPFREKEKKGALLTFKNPDDLAKKIKRLLKNNELRRKYEEGAKKYALENSWANMGLRHLRLYESMVAVKPN